MLQILKDPYSEFLAAISLLKLCYLYKRLFMAYKFTDIISNTYFTKADNIR